MSSWPNFLYVPKGKKRQERAVWSSVSFSSRGLETHTLSALSSIYSMFSSTRNNLIALTTFHSSCCGQGKTYTWMIEARFKRSEWRIQEKCGKDESTRGAEKDIKRHSTSK
ncbi:hypothetical protein C345_03622 [Cryptococcus neoformans A2-102-5]|nr:hypothetical protein C346_03746 [Cryptococcus neoformans var. grubii D17-1]OXG95496.1 hypothetical protein C345_03622 [Cryptococcus neoformans var. grubii A2-102-5]